MNFKLLNSIPWVGVLAACLTAPETIIDPTMTPTPVPATATAIPDPTAAPSPIAASTFAGVRVTFIHFEGFLVTVGDQRFLIDALFGTHPRSVLDPILTSQPPFDNVDLFFATHEHSDHFDPDLVVQYLQRNPRTQFISNPKCVEALLALDSSLSSRLTVIELKRGESQRLNLDGIDIEAFYLSHGLANMLNLGFLITIDGVTFFHVGDMDPDSVRLSELQAYGLPEKGIDIAFANHRLLSDVKYYPHITDGLQATHIIPMHFSGKPPADFELVLPNIRLLREPYESWVMP